MNKSVSVAIVGGGFSGICTFLHLVEKANVPFHVFLIEKQKELAKGIAYGTTSPHHPLNVPAGKMGAFCGQARHFYGWLERSPFWRSLDPFFTHLQIAPESFLPRKLYAVYLKDLLDQAMHEAKKKGITCTILHDEALDVNVTVPNDCMTVFLAQHEPISVDYLVLAVGTPAIKKLPFENAQLLENRHYIGNLWNISLEALRHNVVDGNNKKIVILGSGLTAVDLLFTLHALNYNGSITILSNSGTLPQVHTEKPLSPYADLKKDQLPKELPKLLRWFKNQLQHSSIDWRQLMDALRSFTQMLWQSFSLRSKKQFLRHLFSIWNKHRHRMSPQSLDLEKYFERNGSLHLIASRVNNVASLPNGKLKVIYRSKEKDVEEQLEADMVVNCSGPDYQIKHHPDLLIQKMLNKQIVQPDELGLGLKLAQGMLEGKGNGKIFALGAILFGELLETTAVPELREQANSIATKLIKQIDGRQKPEGGRGESEARMNVS